MRKRNPIMLEEAQERLSKIQMKEETETIWVTEALGRVCAEHIYAVMAQPPPVFFTRAPLDG
ncbi:MAG: molybdopterin molybdenumtransferase MoeA, partial [Clostridia bacterium]|nr:molybdopterin molybdenumtransferase MoeA [Clostridia bacterium]